MAKKEYTVKMDVWVYQGGERASSNAAAMKGSWHFATIPRAQSAAIKKEFGESARGWGSVPVRVTVGGTGWNTSLFPDKKAGGYLLPLKASVRKKEGIAEGDIRSFTIRILL